MAEMEKDPPREYPDMHCGCSVCTRNGYLTIKKSAYYDAHKRYREEDARRAAEENARRAAVQAGRIAQETRWTIEEYARRAALQTEAGPASSGEDEPFYEGYDDDISMQEAFVPPPTQDTPSHIPSPQSDSLHPGDGVPPPQSPHPQQNESQRPSTEDPVEQDPYGLRALRHLLPTLLEGIPNRPPPDELPPRDLLPEDELEDEPVLDVPPNFLGSAQSPPAESPPAPIVFDIDDVPNAQPDDLEAYDATPQPVLLDMKISLAFTELLRDAHLKDCKLPAHIKRQLVEPVEGAPNLDEPGLRYSLDLFLSLRDTAEKQYAKVRRANLREHPDDIILTYEQVREKIVELTGVVSMAEDMCVNSCIAYTGPFAHLETCPYSTCKESRYDQALLAATRHKRGGPKKHPRRQFHTIPVGPQVQCLMRSESRCSGIRYMAEKMAQVEQSAAENGGILPVYDDWCSGIDVRKAYTDFRDETNPDDSEKFTGDDLVLLLSIDGAQLYMLKESDCWIYIWVILNYDPVERYKRSRILLGGVFPGPHKPKNVDSFLFPGLHHVAACQNDGLRAWSALTKSVIPMGLFMAFETADTPGSVYLSGGSGHMSVHPCRNMCEMEGHPKPSDKKTYYPVHIPPDGYDVQAFPKKIDVRKLKYPTPKQYRRRVNFVLASESKADYKRRRKITGISRPSLFAALPRAFGIPRSLTIDIMHLASLNIPDLLLSLWMATIECDKTDSVESWEFAVLRFSDVLERLGGKVGRCKSFIPTSHHAAPRDISKKLHSSYKAKEFQTFLYGYAPAMMMTLLPEKHHDNLCRLVRGVRVAHNHSIHVTDIRDSAILLADFVEQFEQIYCEGRTDRMHFCRPSIHGIAHLIPEVVRVGPGGILSQWTLERVIGLLVGSLRQHSTPYANISAIALLWCQENAIKAFFPELDDNLDYTPPAHARDLTGGYYLLAQFERKPTPLSALELQALWKYLHVSGLVADPEPPVNEATVKRAARLRLPNGQIARSFWCKAESQKRFEDIRMSRNVKLLVNGKTEYAEVRFYFQFSSETENGEVETRTLAMVSVFGPPNMEVFHRTRQCVYLCNYLGEHNLFVVDHTALKSVVAAVALDVDDRVPGTTPYWNSTLDSFKGPFFILEKMGIDLDRLANGMERDEGDK